VLREPVAELASAAAGSNMRVRALKDGGFAHFDRDRSPLASAQVVTRPTTSGRSKTMTRRILITVVLGAGALVLGAQSALANQAPRVDPAVSVGSPKHADFWNYESRVKVADSSPDVLPQDLASLYAGTEDPLGGSPQLASTPGSSWNIHWPQVGIGLGIGIVFVLGLGLIMRVAHVRPFSY
jgi:hypothetical protein